MTLASGGDARLTTVTPGNGESVAEVPATVELVFTVEVPDVELVVAAPDGTTLQDTERVDGATVVAQVPAAGPGDYVVSYAVGSLSGQTGFTVLQPGQAPPVTDVGAGGTVLTVAVAGALVGVLVLTVRRFLSLRPGRGQEPS